MMKIQIHIKRYVRNYKETEAYPHFAEVAKKEGFPAVANVFMMIAKIEGQHAQRFKNILDLLVNEKVYELDENTTWICMKCGYMHKGGKGLKGCPVCGAVNSFMPLNYDFYAVKK